MNLTRIIIIVGGVIIFSNLILYYLVRRDGGALVLSLAISSLEIIVLGLVSWYCLKKTSAKKGSKMIHS